MLGVSGAGKTFLAKQLWTLASHAANWSRCDFIHKPIYWPRFVRDLKAGDAYGLRDDLARWPVLFIDDIEQVITTRRHGNEPLPLSKADIAKLRKAAYSTIKTLQET